MRLATLLFCISTVGLAANWSGYLVDSGCYASRQTNVSGDTTTVDRDMNMDIRYCSPTAETKKFAVVLTNWRGLKLDSAGNVRASQLVRHAVKRSLFDVTVADQKPGTRDSRGRSTFCRVRCPVSLERREPARVHSFPRLRSELFDEPIEGFAVDAGELGPKDFGFCGWRAMRDCPFRPFLFTIPLRKGIAVPHFPRSNAPVNV
jgi:hypothetical protein